MIVKSCFDRGLEWKIGGCVALVAVLSIGVSDRVLAQIVPDKTLGVEGSVVTPNVSIRGIPSDRIDGGATRGANLFHSFEKFNVGSGRSVYFANPAGIENILTRVTGGNPSNILGRLGVLGGANLFLLNPNGIVFGPNASLDIQGSFVATTAERIQLGDSGYFSAPQPQMSSLLSVSPGALFFTEVANQPTAIINQGNLSTRKHLTLSAGNLDLQGQLLSGGDLTLQATDTVKVRDSVTTPFLAQSVGNLTVIGNGGIDILALNHSTQTPFVSEGNLNLVSDGIISGDARFSSGGSFSIKSVSGGLANFVSLYDPIISANGNVDVAANYTGASLLVEATGNIRFQGNINITRPDTSTLSPIPDTAILSTSSALIMRSGQSTLAYGGVNSGTVPASSPGAVPDGITLDGNMTLQRFNDAGAIVSLTTATALGNVNIQGITTNGGAIDIHSAGIISTQGLDTSNGSNDGGAITLEANNGKITTGDLISYSYSTSGNTGNGGKIGLQAKGNISTGNLYSISGSEKGSSVEGGEISLNSANGDISASNLYSFSYSPSNTTGSGGAITLKTNNGKITTGDLISYSYSTSGNTGNGGKIGLQAKGNISTGNLYSISGSEKGSSVEGGEISLNSANGDISASNLYSFSYSPSNTTGSGGAIRLETNGKITTGSINSETNGSENAGDITLTSNNGAIDTTKGTVTSQIWDGSGGTGRGGAIVFKAKGDIETATLNSGAESGNGSLIQLTSINGNINTRGILSSNSLNGNGGEISLEASKGNINTGNLYSTSDSQNGDAGNGGDISINANNGNINTGNLHSYSYSPSGDARNGGNISINTNNGNINTGNLYSYSYSVGNAGNGGVISLVTTTGSFNTGDLVSSSSSFGSAGNGGVISLIAFRNLFVTNTRILTSNELNVGGNGHSGDVNIRSFGDITFNNSSIQNDTKGIDDASNVSIISPGLVTFNNSQIISNTSNSGNAGNIDINAGQGITFQGLYSYQGTPQPGGLFAVTTNSGNAGKITLTTPLAI
ncbi:filamentous hemagglutinin N-terminal domain-containing protein [uncultured Nostoc sp.]|uniref:two-partner secretion domain-containing protein n=1 Tax=uncultured Nostoc sp. TaxID=340711 RepID=UPI0035C9605A